VTADGYVDAIVQVAERDASIARVLREICALDGAVRAGALELVGAHLRTHAAAADVLQCVQALREDAVARRIAERLGPPG
jgi:DNA-binding FrmR family transcriptional regulator